MGARTGKRRLLSPALGTGMFLVTAVLIGLSVGSAVFLTDSLGKQVAERELTLAVSKSQSVQASFQQQRFEQLGLISDILAGDPFLAASIAEATADTEREDEEDEEAVEEEELAEAGTDSILDLLDERQGELGFDLAIVLDPDGRVLARTDDPEATGEDLSHRSLVARAVEENLAFGVWQEGRRLYNAVAVTLVEEFEFIGLLVSGSAINDVFAREVRNVSSAEIAFLSKTPSGAEVVATTLDPNLAAQLLLALRGQGALGEVLSRVGERRLVLDREEWVALLNPLRNGADETVGATIALASAAKAVATYRQIERILVGVGILAILLALALSYAISRRAMRPVRQLAAAVEGATQGHYDQRIAVGRAGVAGRLGRALDTLLGELREKREMEDYLRSLSRTLPEPLRERETIVPAQSGEGAVLAVELRRYANPRLGFDPEQTLERLSRDLRQAAAAVTAHRGRVDGVFGHRLLASFEGDGRGVRALSAATEIVVQLSVRESAFEEVEPPVAALASGEVLSGSVVLADHPEHAIIGLPVQQLEILLREATPGDILLAQPVYEELAPAFKRAGYELSPQRGLVSSQPIYHVRAEMAARVTGVQPEGAVVTEPAVHEGGASSAEVAPGAVLGERFEILSILGAGGTGVVYKARDRDLDDLVAVKVLRREAWGNPVELDRVKRELGLARRLNHPNILRIFDFGDLDGVSYVSMEYVRGLTLRYLLGRTGRLPFSAALRLSKQLCAALAAAHAEGVTHRDLKPESVILESAGNAKLMDFGLAPPAQRVDGGQGQAGAVAGMAHYLAPEQVTGREPDPRVDIYACGVLLYEIFTGRLPFAGSSPMEIVAQHLRRPPTPPRTHWGAMPERLEKIILKCLAKRPEGRFSGMVELWRALETVRT